MIEDRAPLRDDPDAALRRRLTQQAAVAALGRAALGGASAEAIMPLAVAHVADGLGTELAAILRRDAELDALVCHDSVGWTPEMVRPVPLVAESQLAVTFRMGEAVVVADLAADPRWPASQHLLAHGIVSGISVPMASAERSYGVLAAHSRTRLRFDRDDLAFLDGVANVLAAALLAEETAAERERAAARLSLLAEATRVLADAEDVEQALRGFASLLVPALADRCAVLVRLDERVEPLTGEDPTLAAAAAAVVRGGESELTPRRVVAPIVARDGVVGAIAFASDGRPLEYGELDRAVAVELGLRAGAAIDAARLVEERERSLDRAVRLQRVSSALGGAAGREEVLSILIDHGRAASGAERALVALDVGGRQAEIVAAHGYGSAIDAWALFAIDEAYPIGRAMLRREGVYCVSRAERDEAFPSMIGEGPPGSHAMVVLPLLGAQGPFGALALSFADERTFDADGRRFLETLAAQCAQALERADASDRLRRLADDLELERERLRAVLEQMPSGVILADAEGRVVLANPQVEAIWQRSPEDETFRAFHPDGTPYAAEDWPLARTLRCGETVQGEEVAIERGDGSRGYLSVSSAPIRDADGNVAAGVVIFADVTGEVEAREAAERRADAAAALAFVADGICLVDRGGAVRLWNEGARRVTGVRAEDVLGRSIREALPGWRHLEPRIPVANAGESPPRPLTLPLEVGGEEQWLSISGVRFEGGAVFAFRDVTAEHGLETMKSDFIATVSHELRTPLSAVYGAATTLRTRSTLGPEEREQFLVMIEQQAERLSRIVNEILVASRVETGEIAVALTRVDGVAVVDDVVRMVRRGPGADFEVSVLPHGALPHVVADPDRLRQVLANLVENAVKYSGESRRVEVAISYANACVRFAVRDFGIGIAPSERERIFEKFYRVDPSMTGGVSGTGLGLYIVRELVDRMRGSLRVEETPGGGSTFVVELPAS